MRLAKMSDANSVAGVTIRALTDENIELARAVTDKEGIAEFPKERVFPKTSDSKAKNTHLFIADTTTGPALQFADATAYSSGTDSALFTEQTARRDYHGSQSLSSWPYREDEGVGA
jgi:hypothetical protein